MKYQKSFDKLYKIFIFFMASIIANFNFIYSLINYINYMNIYIYIYLKKQKFNKKK